MTDTTTANNTTEDRMNVIDRGKSELEEKFPRGCRVQYDGHFGKVQGVVEDCYPGVDEDLRREPDCDSIKIAVDLTTWKPHERYGGDPIPFPYSSNTIAPSVDEITRI